MKKQLLLLLVTTTSILPLRAQNFLSYKDGQNISLAFARAGNFTLTIASGAATQSGVLSDATGGPMSIIKSGAGMITLTGANTYTGGTTVDFGTLQAGAAGTLPDHTAYIINSNGSLDVAGNGDLTMSSLSGSGGQIKSALYNLLVDQSAATTYRGSILARDNILKKEGTGTLTLTNNDSEIKEVHANGGTLVVTGKIFTGGIGVGRAVGTTGALTLSGSDSLLQVSGPGSFITVGDSVVSTGTLTVENGGRITLNDTGAKLTVGWTNATGTLNLNTGGTIEIGGANGLQKAATGTTQVNFGGGTLVVSAAFTTSVPITLVSGTTSTIDTRNFTAADAVFSGALSGDGGLVKTSAGTLLLEAANTYTGATTIAAGTLKLGASGSLTTTSGIALASGATFDVSAVNGFTLGPAQTLSGSGTVLGDVTVAGTLAPGNSPGLLTFAGDLTLQSTSLLLFQLGGSDRGASYDAIDVGGDLFYGGTLTLSLIDGFTPQVGDTFQLFGFDGAASGTFADLQFTSAGLAGVFNYDTGSLQITAIPEPATYALLTGLGALLLAVWRRRSATA